MKEKSIQIFTIPREGSYCICISLVLIEFWPLILKMGKSYYPQVFLEEWKCIAKEK